MAITGSLMKSALPDLSIWCDKCILTPWYFFQDAVTKIFHEHLFFALHVFYYDISDSFIWVVFKAGLVFHYLGSGFLTFHFYKDCAQDRLGGVVAGFGRKFSHSFGYVPVDIYSSSFYFSKDYPDHIKISLTCCRKGKSPNSQAKPFRYIIYTAYLGFNGVKSSGVTFDFNSKLIILRLFGVNV